MTPQRIAKLRAVLDKRQPDLTVITDYVHKGRNLSAIVRTADAVGIQTVNCVIGDKDFHAFRGTAMGSHNWVDVIPHSNLQQPIQQAKQAGMQIVAAHLSDCALDYHNVDFTQPTAFLFGAEKQGLDKQALACADIHVTIPMVGMVESFNVSVAAGIILSEARHQRQQQGYYDGQRISDKLYQRLFFEWGHPVVRDYCRENNLDYPPLNHEGEIDNPSQWYADVRAGKV